MPELSVTDDQRRRLEAVCDDLEDAFVGPYGTVRPGDAFEYLLDTYTPPGESNVGSAEGASGRGPARDAPGSSPVAVGTTDRAAREAAVADDASAGATGGDGLATGVAAHEGADVVGESDADDPTDVDGESDADDLTDVDLTSVPGVGEVTAEALADAGFDSVSAIRAADPAALTAAVGVGEKQAADIAAAVAELSTDDGPDSDGDGESAVPGDFADAGSESPESALRQAMDLLEAHDDRWREGSGDEPYEVDLPGGSTEGVRTKDDVKRLLFKHWR